MKNLSKYFCLSAIALGLWSCSKDEPVIDDTIKTFEGNNVAMKIQICTPAAGVRAVDETNDENYKNGEGAENSVSEVNFYFYDKAGDYVTCYENASIETKEEDNDPLIERIGTSKIILTNLLGKNYPSYVVCVLNYKPAEGETNVFKQSLAELKEEALKKNPWTSVNNNITKFLMTTATHKDNSRTFWYFATPITEENFALQPDGTNQGDLWKDEWNDEELGIKPIDVYVERLAAKVEVIFPALTYTLSSDGYYETFIKTHDKTADSTFNINGMDDCKIKIRIYGWGINGQAKSVKYMKTVNEGQNPFITSDGWDFNGTHRCYWAKTPKYNSGDYPNDFNSVKNKTGIGGLGNYTDDLANDESLKYISWNTVKNNKFKDKNTAYVMPHTEAGEQINLAGEVRHSAVTEVLLAAQVMVTDAQGNVLKDKDGKEQGLELFEISGTLYTLDGVKNYVLNSAGGHLFREKDVKYFDAEGNELSEYVEGCKKVIYSVESIQADDINIIYDYDGAFQFQLTEDAYYTHWYRSYEDVKDDDGNFVTIEMKQEYSTPMSVQDEVNSYLPAKQSWAYKDGMMYYNIPIRHLRPLPAATAADKSILTGMYGVVRNHWYQVTIGSVTNLGHAVYRPSEHIIPPSDATRYMIGSKINILSWRLVSQTAEL